MALPNGKWYDEATLEEMHEDLKVEYLKTLAIIAVRPVLLKHFNSCPECQTIKAAQEAEHAADAVQLDAHRRRKLVLGHSELRAILGVKANQEIVALEVKQDPMTLTVLLTGPDEPFTLLNVEAPATLLTVEAA